MVRIWAKIICDNKIVKDIIYENPSVFTADSFFNYLADISEKLNIATPIPLSKHLNQFLEFNTTTFFPSDFAEEINFDKLVLEQANI